MMTKTVVHLTRDYPPRVRGGLSVAVAGWIDCSRHSGLEHGVVSFDGYRPARTARGRSSIVTESMSTDLAVGRVSDPSALSSVAPFALNLRPSIVHVHDPLLWEIGETVAAAASCPCVYSVHVHQAEMSRLRQLTAPTKSEQAERQALTQAARVHAPSRYTRDALVTRDGVSSRRISIVGLGVDPYIEPEVHAAQHPKARSPRILYAGRLSDLKGTKVFFEAAARLLALEPEVHVDIVGGLPDNARAERRWREQWLRCVEEVGSHRARWHGWQPRAALFERFKEADLLVVPSLTETYGLTALEGMSTGLPIVATPVGAMADYITPRHGRLVPAGDVDALVATVQDLVEAPDHLRQLGRNAACRVRQEHLWRHRAVEIHNFYRDF